MLMLDSDSLTPSFEVSPYFIYLLFYPPEYRYHLSFIRCRSFFRRILFQPFVATLSRITIQDEIYCLIEPLHEVV